MVFVDDGGSVVYLSVVLWDLLFGSTGLPAVCSLAGLWSSQARRLAVSYNRIPAPEVVGHS